MDWDAITSDPVVIATVIATVVAIHAGARKIGAALVAAIVRALGQVANDHDPEHVDDAKEIVKKVRAYRDHSTVRRRVESSLMATMPATVIISQAKLRNSKLPPKDGS